MAQLLAHSTAQATVGPERISEMREGDSSHDWRCPCFLIRFPSGEPREAFSEYGLQPGVTGAHTHFHQAQDRARDRRVDSNPFG